MYTPIYDPILQEQADYYRTSRDCGEPSLEPPDDPVEDLLQSDWIFEAIEELARDDDDLRERFEKADTDFDEDGEVTYINTAAISEDRGLWMLLERMAEDRVNRGPDWY